MKTKRISQTPIIDSVGEYTNIVVEDGDETKRIPANKVGRVKTVNGVEPDEAGNVEIEIPECKVQTVNGVEPDEAGNVEIEIPEKTHWVEEGYITHSASFGGIVNPAYPLTKPAGVTGNNIGYVLLSPTPITSFDDFEYGNLSVYTNGSKQTLNFF